MPLYLIIGVCLVVIAYNLRRRGFFGPDTSSRERWASAIRYLFWFGSILVVAWPLRSYREALGEVAYVGSAFLILGLFFVLGLAAERLITRSHGRSS